MTAMGSSLAGCPSSSGGGSTKEGSPSGGPSPVPGGAVSKITLAAAPTLRVLSGKVTVPLGCEGGSPCKLKLALTSSALGKAARVARSKKVLVGSASTTVAAGTTAHVVVHLTKRGLRLLASHRGKIKSRLSVTGSAGTVTLRQTNIVTFLASRHR
jgi:hypothetical protein